MAQKAVVQKEIAELLEPTGLRLITVTNNGKCRVEVPGNGQQKRRTKWMHFKALIAQAKAALAGNGNSSLFSKPAAARKAPNSAYRVNRSASPTTATATSVAFPSGHRIGRQTPLAFAGANQQRW